MTGLAVSRCSSWLSAFSSLDRPIERTGLPSSRCLRMRSNRSRLRVASLSPPLAILALRSTAFSTDCRSASASSVSMISMSRIGSTPPDTCTTSDPRSSAPRARWRRSRGCATGTCCPGPRPARRRPPGPRCRRTPPWSGTIFSGSTIFCQLRPAAYPAPARCRRSDRWCRTDSSPPRSARASAR